MGANANRPLDPEVATIKQSEQAATVVLSGPVAAAGCHSGLRIRSRLSDK
jgi:hypothetical protein